MQKNPRHLNKVRIIAGSHRSRWVKFPDVNGLRPTADMIREKVFNWLGQYLYGKKVLDLFSGSGIFAFESASRGAQYIVAVENQRNAYRAIVNNRNSLELFNVCAIQKNTLDYFAEINERFDIIFLDPPYIWQQWDELLQLLPKRLNYQGYAYVESGHLIEFPETLTIVKYGKNGKSYYYLVSISNLEKGEANYYEYNKRTR